MDSLKLLLTWTWTLTVLTSIQAAKFLLIPGPSTSHCLETMAVGKELLKRGHDVTLFAHLLEPNHCTERWTVDTTKFKVVSPQVHKDVINTHNTMLSAFEQSLTGSDNTLGVIFTIIKPLIRTFCNSLFSDRNLRHDLEKERYDFAIVDGFPFTSCIFAFPVHLGIPFAAIGASIDPQDAGIPLQSNTFPHYFSKYTSEMSFTERFLNTIIFFLHPVLKYIILPSVDLPQDSNNLKGVDTDSLIRNSVLFLENSDCLVDYPKAVFPNFLQVGALTASPPHLLTLFLRKYIEESKDGIILVTFGAGIINISEEITEKIITALQGCKERIILKHKKDGIMGNIKTMTWVPQNDILGHPNVKLFISHCGKNGFWEAVYHGVPILCTPFGTDAIATGIKVKKHAIGSSINIFEATSNEIYNTIQSVLNNADIEKNIKKMSAILRDRPETPSQRAATAIEHVIKYGSDHMQPVRTSFFGHIYADIWLTLYLGHLFMCLLIIKACSRCFCTKRKGKPKED